MDHVSKSAPHEMDRLEMRFGSSDVERLNRHKRTAGVDHNRKMTIIIPKSVIKNSCTSSCNPAIRSQRLSVLTHNSHLIQVIYLFLNSNRF